MSKARSAAGVALSIIVGAVCALGGFYGVDRFINGRKATYSSTVSALTFQYPAKWEKVDGGDYASLGKIAGIERFNEILLSDSTGSNMNLLVGAGSVANPAVDWETGKRNVESLFKSGFQGVLPAMGATISNASITEGTVDGEESMDVTFDIALAGETANCRVSLFHKDSVVYMMLFMTMGGDSDGQVQQIMKSIDLRD